MKEKLFLPSQVWLVQDLPLKYQGIVSEFNIWSLITKHDYIVLHGIVLYYII